MDARYEIKFILDESKLSKAIQWLLNDTTAIEKYKKRVVNSIYFDDVDFSSIRDNLAGVSERSKMRLRWYNSKDNSLPIFEVKTRNGRLGSKFSYPIESLNKKLNETSLHDITIRCIEDLLSKSIIIDSHIVPTLHVEYEREYFETHNGIRITVDNSIRFYEPLLYEKVCEGSSLTYPMKVMELKFEKEMKDEVSKLIQPLNMIPKRHSKYLVGMASLGHAIYI
jgi:SPX domain protein involved in polyphosphate accumulation